MRILTRLFGSNAPTRLITGSLGLLYDEQPREMYELLRYYYYNNGLYDALRAGLYQIGAEDESLRPLRNPANRVVEFYAAKLWPGALPGALGISAQNERIEEPLRRVWRWSNFGARKQVWARWQALYGDVFVKVASDAAAGRVWYQLIDPRYVTDFSVDNRSYLRYVQIDIPRGEQTHTEIWDADAGMARFWTAHTLGAGASVEALGTPDRAMPLEEMGIDFVPIVHIKHRDVGDRRGAGAFQLALDQIDEANRMATRLHRMLFRHNKNLWVLRANSVDKSGRPMPPPRVGTDGTDTLEVGDDSVIRLPGNSQLDSMVPQIDYDAALSVLNAHVLELENELPELRYYRLQEGGELSGRAVRLMLSAAIDRLEEARGNALDGLARAGAMALTLGQAAGLWGRDVGRYDAGDFVHTYTAADPFPISALEQSEMVRNYTQAGVPLVAALRFAGYSEAEIEMVLQAQADERAAEESQLAKALLDAQREFDRG